MTSQGLYVDLAPWNYHFFHCLRADKSNAHHLLDIGLPTVDDEEAGTTLRDTQT